MLNEAELRVLIDTTEFVPAAPLDQSIGSVHVDSLLPVLLQES